MFIDENDTVLKEFGIYLGDMTPPQAEYNTIIAALDEAASICRGEIEVWTDSELIVKQMSGEYGIKSPNMKPLYDEAKKLHGRFSRVRYFHHSVPAMLAKRADQLAEIEFKKHHQ